MIRKIINLILLIGLILIEYNLSFADSAGSFLRLAAGARPQGIGNSFCAVSDDATSTYWNPAGLGQIRIQQIVSMRSQLSLDRNYNFVSFVTPLHKRTSIGVSFISFTLDGIEIWEGNLRKGTASDTEEAYILSYGKKIRKDNFIGINYKIINQRVYTKSANGSAFDIGYLYSLNRGISGGVVIQNLWGTLKWNTQTGKVDKIPLILREGIAYKNENLLLSADLENVEEENTKFHGGIEYKLFDMIALRGGYDEKDITYGVGIKLSNFQVDYAYKNGTLGDTQKVSLLFFWK